MSLQIYLAHSGQRLQADPISFSSPDALKSWIANQVLIPPDRQILITGRGKNVRQQNLLTETEVFVYDKQYISPSGADRPSETQPLQPPDLREPPTTLVNQTSLQAWRELFKARKSWAAEVAGLVTPYRDIIRQNLDETEIIERASILAFDNLQSHVRNLQTRFEETKAWARGAIKDQEDILRDWKSNLPILGKVPAKREFAFLLQRPRTPTKRKPSRQSEISDEGTLRSFINEQDVERAASELSFAANEFRTHLEELEAAMGDISADTRQIGTEMQLSSENLNSDDISTLYDDVETITKKIGSDYEDLLRMPDNQKSVSTASRRALIHTRDLLPSLQNLAGEISQNAQQAVIRRNLCLEFSTRTLQAISVIQSGLGDFQSQTGSLGLTSEGMEAYDVVRFVSDLPIAYGSTLIESIRRSEWADRMKASADRVAEKLRSYKDDEHRRRKKWIKSMAGLINDIPDEFGLGIELSVPQNDNEWPVSTRQEVFDYVDALRNAQIDDVVQQVTHLMKELETSKPRTRSTRAFKNGSVYDADLALGGSSVLMEDEDDATKALKDEKSRLETRLRASDSRVRKLEDLLHRQSQINRPNSANFGPSPLEIDRPPQSPARLPSPRPSELMSRRSSVSSRRMSSNQNPEEKVLIQRIVSLEADLYAERDTVLRLQREAHVDRRASTESRDRMNEAESTKKDLLANLEAQRIEFEDERQLLEDEMHKLKIRLEEVEDELDRVLGSRDHQKMTVDSTIIDLRGEIDRLRRDSSEEVAKACTQADQIRNDLDFQRSRANALEKQLQQAKEEYSSLQSQNLNLANQLRDQADSQLEHISSLQAAHSHLSPSGSAPEDLGRLARAVEILSEGLAIHARTTDEAAQLTSAENKSLEEQLAQIKNELDQAKNKLTHEETERLTLREEVTQERSKLASMRHKFNDAQAELSNFRGKFAAGETGSEALKERVAEEERKVAELTEKLAVADSNTQSFEQEILIWKDKVQSLDEEAKQWKDRLDVRGVRAKDLSQRLMAHNDRMIRMLEQMGYSVVRQDDQLVIQRASKVNASTVLAGEGSTPVNPSFSVQSPIQHHSSTSDLDTLYWMSESDATSEEIKFQNFISTITRLDFEAATDMVSKRYKDVETLARKYQKDSRAYRERAHRLQSEANDKIAYRSFKEGDLALFLPTRNQATRPWAAFNVGAPHYFLREQDIHKLQTRDWLLARISKVEERVVDLSRSLTKGQQGHNPPTNTDRYSINTEASDHGSTRSVDDENPFELSDGLRWYLLDATEEKPGTAPVLTPGLGKSTVAATNVDAKGSIRLTKEGKKIRDVGASGSGAALATKTLSKSLDSRRSSSGSKKGGHPASPNMTSNLPAVAATSENAVAESLASRPTSSENAQSQSHRNFMASASVKPAESDAKPDEQAREDAPIFEAEARSIMSPSKRDKQSSTNSLIVQRSNSDTPNPSPSKQQRQTQTQRQSSSRKRTSGWDRLWSLDYSFESGGGGGK